MNNSRQILFIGILFIGLMLLSAGIGALAAGEALIGTIFLVCGLILVIFDGSILYLIRKKQRIAGQANITASEPEPEQEPEPKPEE